MPERLAGALGGPVGMSSLPPSFNSGFGAGPRPSNFYAAYRNMYGTEGGINVDPTGRTAGVNFSFPVGRAENAFSIQGKADYNAINNQPSFSIGFSKKNVSSDPNIARSQLGLDDPNRDKYGFVVGMNGEPGFGGTGFQVPRMAGQIAEPVTPGFTYGAAPVGFNPEEETKESASRYNNQQRVADYFSRPWY